MTSVALCSSPSLLDSSSAAQPIIARHNTATPIDSNFIMITPSSVFIFPVVLSIPSTGRRFSFQSSYPAQPARAGVSTKNQSILIAAIPEDLDHSVLQIHSSRLQEKNSGKEPEIDVASSYFVGHKQKGHPATG